jgi:flagellar operon protein (TIGR03826 family)
MPLSNCKRCGSVFARTNKSICPKCFEKEEEDFKRAVDWLRENPGRTIQKLSDETGIKQSLVLQWIREKRITIGQASGLLCCNKCGVPIQSGNYCDHCKLGLSQAVQDGLKTIQEEQLSASQKAARGMHYRPEERINRGRAT